MATFALFVGATYSYNLRRNEENRNARLINNNKRKAYLPLFSYSVYIHISNEYVGKNQSKHSNVSKKSRNNFTQLIFERYINESHNRSLTTSYSFNCKLSMESLSSSVASASGEVAKNDASKI